MANTRQDLFNRIGNTVDTAGQVTDGSEATWSAGVAFKRSNPIPIDKYSVFKTLTEAENYASKNAVAYPGQTLAVIPESGKTELYVIQGNGTLEKCSGGEGDVTGPNSSTDNAIVRFDGTSGKIIQNSNATIDDSGNGSFNGYLKVGGEGNSSTFSNNSLSFFNVGSLNFNTSSDLLSLENVYDIDINTLGTLKLDSSYNTVIHANSDGKAYYYKTTVPATLEDSHEIATIGDISIPTIVISLDTTQTEYNQIVAMPGTHGSSTYFTLTTTPSQRMILENENNGIIKIDLTGLGQYAPVPYIWVKRNVGQTLQSLNLIQFTFDNAGFIYDNAISQGYVYMNKIGNGGVIYEATSSKYLFITYENFNPDSVIASIPTNLKNSSGSASLIQTQFNTFTTSNSQALADGYTGNVSVQATGAASIVLGGISRAEGDSSLVCGKNNIATGWASTALGNYTYASGSSSFATGDRATASGTASSALGQGVVAAGGTQTVVGRWNSTTGISNYAFVVGNGSSSSRSNAMTVDWNGWVVVKGGLKINGNKDVLTLDTLPIWNGDVE